MSDKVISEDFDDMLDDFEKLNDNIEQQLSKIRGKNSRSEISGYGINFDSKEELDFHEWVLEAKELGFIDNFVYQPESFVLYDGAKNDKDKFIVRPHIYSPDYKISFNDKWINFKKTNKLKIFDKFDEKTVYIDVKGNWNPHSGDREFSINQKFVLFRYNVYVHKVQIPNFFKHAWLPKNCVFTRKTHKMSLRYAGIKTFGKHGWSI